MSSDALSYELHKLTARLDRTADALLRAQAGISYARFLALFAVAQEAESQRALSDWLAQSEPSTSRMVGVLAEAGLLTVTRPVGIGNRRRLQLTDAGSELVARCAAMLEQRFAALVDQAGVSYDSLQESTRRLLDQLEREPERA
jgi:DNA-binding MarR family transcriptional regulator